MNFNNFYQSKEWVNLRAVLMAERLNDDGFIICAHCGKPIINAYDCIGHHKIALTEANVNDVEISLNPNNIDLVHHACHNSIHNKLGYVIRQVYLVWGSPLSGKSTYVDSVKEYGDLVVDIDSIWQCLSGCDRYIKPNRLKSNVFGVRDTLIDMVKYRRGNWNNAYIIGGYPLIRERERLIKMLGAREIYIDVSMDECLARLETINDERNKSEWKKYIESWWRKSNMGPPGSS